MERWEELEEYLNQCYIRRFGRNARAHPQLLLYCRRARLIRLFQSGSTHEAIQFYVRSIGSLRHAHSEAHIISQIATIWESMTHDARLTELVASHPPNVSDLINDHMRMHFPEAENVVLASGSTVAPPPVQGVGMAGVHTHGPLVTRTRVLNQRQIHHQGSTSAVSAAAVNPSVNPSGSRDPRASTPSLQAVSIVAQAAPQDGVQRFHMYSAEFVERLAREERWHELDEYLIQYIRRFGNTERLHQQLLLYCRRAWLLHLLQVGRLSDATRFYHGYIGPLRHVYSDMGNTEQIRSQTDLIWRSMIYDPSFTELLQSHPPNVADRINDYMRLHFADAIGHTNPAGTISPVWRFAVLLGRESDKQRLRCIFCQEVFVTRKAGEVMKKHLKTCPKVTLKWTPIVKSVSSQSNSKKRPRVNIDEVDHNQIDLILSIEMLIRQVAQGAMPILASLGCNEQAVVYLKELQYYFDSLVNGTCPIDETVILVSRLVRDVMAAHLVEPESLANRAITTDLQELMICSYQLEYLVPVMRNPVPLSEAQQQVLAEPLAQQQQPPPLQNDDPQMSNPQQQVVATPSAQQQQQNDDQLVSYPQQQLVPTTSAQPQQLRVQNEDTLVSGSQHHFDPTALTEEELHRLIEIDPRSYDDEIIQMSLEVQDFLDTPVAGPSPPFPSDDVDH